MASSLRIAALGAASAFVISLCTGGAACAQTFSDKHGAIHFMYTPEYAKRIGRVPNQKASGPVYYYGGTVFGRVKVASVIWGPNVNQETVKGMPGFLKAMPNSTYQDQLSEYNTKGLTGVNGHRGFNQNLKRGGYIGQYVITPRNQNTTITDNNVQAELKYQIRKHNLPANTTRILYMIYFPANVTIESFGLLSCVNFGAYHFASKVRPRTTNIYYGVMPDCGYSFNSHTIVSSHEFSEATTDNIPTPGSNPDYPQAWNSAAGYEIGDLCEGTQGTLTTSKATYYVQQEYLNSKNGCSTGNYTSP
jgi:hypothetical protein